MHLLALRSILRLHDCTLPPQSSLRKFYTRCKWSGPRVHIASFSFQVMVHLLPVSTAQLAFWHIAKLGELHAWLLSLYRSQMDVNTSAILSLKRPKNNAGRYHHLKMLILFQMQFASHQKRYARFFVYMLFLLELQLSSSDWLTDW